MEEVRPAGPASGLPMRGPVQAGSSHDAARQSEDDDDEGLVGVSSKKTDHRALERPPKRPGGPRRCGEQCRCFGGFGSMACCGGQRSCSLGSTVHGERHYCWQCLGVPPFDDWPLDDQVSADWMVQQGPRHDWLFWEFPQIGQRGGPAVRREANEYSSEGAVSSASPWRGGGSEEAAWPTH